MTEFFLIYRRFSQAFHASLAQFHLCHREKYNMCLSLQGITASIGSPADEGLPQLGLFAKGRCRKKECITANKSKFLPKVSESSRLGEKPF